MEADDIKIFKDSYETHKARKDALEKSIAEKKKNNEIVGDAEICQLGFSSGIVSALTDIALRIRRRASFSSPFIFCLYELQVWVKYTLLQTYK